MEEPTSPATIHMPAAVKIGGHDLVPALTIVFDLLVIDKKGTQSEEQQREYFAEHAAAFCDALQSHAPQGFVDHVFAELAKRKASIFVVAQ